MAIVKMKKFKLFALEKDRKSLLKELQKFSYVHFVKTKEEDESLKEIELNQDKTTIKEKSQKVISMIPLGRRAEPVEIAQMILFLEM